MSAQRDVTFRKEKLMPVVGLATAALLCVLPLFAAYSQSQPSPAEKLYGVWENKDYDGGFLTFLENGYRFRWDPDGKGYGYDTEEPPDPTKETRFTIDKPWTDEDGSVWLLVLATRRWAA